METEVELKKEELKGKQLENYKAAMEVINMSKDTENDIDIDKVLTIEVPDDKIIQRLSGRLECKSCGSTFHKLYRIPKKEGICDNCGGELTTRADDKPDVIKHRLEVYHNQTEPLKQFYKDKGILRVAVGQEEIKDTTAAVIEALKD